MLPANYTYYKSNDEAKNEVTFRVKEITDKESAYEWVRKLSSNSLITWRVARTYPSTSRFYVYRIDFRCQHATDKRAKIARKNTNCPAELNIIIRRPRAKTYKKKHIDDATRTYPCVVTFKGRHNHDINSASVLKYRDLCDNSRKKLFCLFQRGHSPSSAFHCLKIDVMLEHGDNYKTKSTDSYYVPSENIVQKLFYNDFSGEYGKKSNEEILEYLEVILDKYNQNIKNGYAKMQKSKNGKHHYVVICTPIMRRAHENLPESKELVVIDTAKGLKRKNHRIYSLVAPTVAGGIPLGIIITNTKLFFVFIEALKYLLCIFPNSAFYGQGFPNTFLINNTLEEKKLLQDEFPKSIVLLYQHYVCKSVWNWILDDNHKVSKCDHHELYSLFKSVLFAATKTEAEQNFFKFCSSKKVQKYLELIEYVGNFWNNRECWISYCRYKLTLLHTDINYLEIVFHIIKEYLLDKIMSFNLVQMVDFILTRYEHYIEKMLINFINNGYYKSMLKELMIVCNVNILPYSISCSNNPGCFIVQNKTAEEFNVDIFNGFCSCSTRDNEKLCEHACAVVLQLDHELLTSNEPVKRNLNQRLYFIATGSFFESSQICSNDLIIKQSEIKNYSDKVLSTDMITNDLSSHVLIECSDDDSSCTDTETDDNIIELSQMETSSPDEMYCILDTELNKYLFK